MNNLNEVLGNISEFLKSEAKTETIIGQQFKLGEFTCVPVMSVGLGFGGGGGEGKGNAKNTGEGEGTGTGAGAGMGMGPVGFLVTKGDEIQFIPTRSSKGLSAVFEKVPDLIEKFMDKKKADAASN
ncbi:MAG TPA: GerW family sporulation protein [Chitinophagales bacterium]|nr:GerW family sporulation protein [Chitinophagales bacterium]